jgi:hypothetical protein
MSIRYPARPKPFGLDRRYSDSATAAVLTLQNGLKMDPLPKNLTLVFTVDTMDKSTRTRFLSPAVEQRHSCAFLFSLMTGLAERLGASTTVKFFCSLIHDSGILLKILSAGYPSSRTWRFFLSANEVIDRIRLIHRPLKQTNI